MKNSNPQTRRLLLFNLATDADDSALGFALEWIAELAKHTAHIDIITMRAGRYELPEHVRVYSVGKEKGYSEPRRFIEFYRILFQLLRQHRYDGCFSHMMPLFVVMAAPILQLSKIPIVLWYAHKSVTPMLHLATFVAQRIVTSVQEGFCIKTNKLRLIGQGIATERFVPGDDSEHQHQTFTILTVGRISEIKRVDLLVDAVAILRQDAPEIPLRLAIIGEPLTQKDRVYAESITRQIYQKHLKDITMMPGRISFGDILHHYQGADCFVNLCPPGAIDKVVLEAMSCGVIPIITNHSLAAAFNETLAALCLIEVNPETLAEHLFQVYSLSFEKRRTLGRQLREIVVRDHDLKQLSLKILNEFDLLVEKKNDKAN